MSENDNYRPIREWNEDDRPREKLQLKGKSNLSDAELVAILLGSGTRRESAVELARRVLHLADNNLLELGKLSLTQLQKLPGIGPVKAITLTAAFELGRRRQESEPVRRGQVLNSRDIYNIFGPRLGDLRHEEFWIMCLNRNNRILGTSRIGAGGISATVADVRLILHYAIERHASCLILCHNHPSGNTTPSDADIKLTHSIQQAAKYMDIVLLDHLIVTDSSYFSFADESKL
ncbi:MAG TPA: DNA repair protein RadC [Flavobacteriales bacterium]|jgi:DNA repair protein RadC|nr:DNA repair protein RadC [Flavobacteriales bacterium]HPH82978.1 DNA repair protein RadC [Flavobacteriales bacterium]